MESVESVCNSLAKHKILEVDVVRTLRARWREQAGERVEQVPEFKRWLVKTGRVTDFQLDLLTRGFGDRLFLEDYKLFDRIGVGRSAGVYQAFHASGQKVAIKVLPPTKAKNQQILGRFLREARLAVRLDHDNVIRTFHQGQDREGMHFIVMEYLDGETLDEVLARRKRLPVNEALPLIIQALQGLQHLDEKGLIHRDLKPANMIVVPGRIPNEPDTTLKTTLKILDIGLSRALFDEGDPSTKEAHDLTREGTLLGTMNYMAPEQARDAHGADIRADIYSLGCVLYELLSGQPPFTDPNLARQIRRHAEERPKPLMEAAPGTPEALDAIVQKMLAKDPAMRYLTPGQALKDLRNFLSSLGAEPAAPKPAKPLGTFLTWLETKRTDDEASPASPPAGNIPASIPVPIPVPVPPPAPVAAPPVAAAPPAAVDSEKTVRIPLNVPPAPLPVPVSTPTVAAPIPVPVVAPARVLSAIPLGPAPSEKPVAPASVGGRPTATSAPGAKDSTVGSAALDLLRHLLGFLNKLVVSLIRLSLRDWICIGSGAAAMLIATWVWTKFFGR